MAKVRYVQGKKASYLALGSYDPMALYFCTDTNELFKGDQLYSDGVRIVLNYASLPAFNVAADGILYYCKDSGAGYVLNEERTGWLAVIHGIDNETIELNDNGLMAVAAIPIAKVTGLAEELQRIEAVAIAGGSVATTETAGIVKPGNEFAITEDGTLSLNAVAITKVTGLEERLSAVEAAVVGGIHYRGAVDTVDDLPADASEGDLYEVRADASEWCFNGEKWFEYGKTVDIDLSIYAEKDEVRTIAKMVDYEISHKPDGALVNYTDDEIRVMCAADTEWALQQSGEGADPNMYYIGFKAYAPNDDIVSFKEDLAEIISDATMYYFENNEFAGVDEFGRKYSIVWLPVAAYDETSDTWSYYGAMSSDEKYIGWYYSVEWYDAAGVKVATDTIRINLTNEDCHTSVVPFYVADVKAAIASLEESMTWENI
ncbi:MAG: hypothetical protein IKK89_10960 [Alistipes sp.]|nr:hypothetical protein [Alistipes sp.]